MRISSPILSKLESLRFQPLAALGKRIFPVVFQDRGMEAIPFDGPGFSKGGHIIFLWGIAPIEDAVRPLAPSLGGRENPRPDYSTPFQKRSAFFVDLIKDASTNSAWPSKKQTPHFSLCHAFAFDF